MTAEATRFGKYELLDLLGEGGMARVFRAHQTGPMGFRKEVALKQIRPHVSREEKMLRALINEARLGGNLHHKNVVEVYDFGEAGDTMYIAMEYIRGHTLHEVLRQIPRRGSLPPRIIAEIAMQLCEGLAYAHSAADVDGRPMNLVHRDLKPANVIVDLSGVVKIMDFGIARADTNLFHTTTNMTKGTPIYMSPEQVKKSEDRPLTGRADLFSLATVITEMVTGEIVFQGTELYEVLHKIANAETTVQVARVGQRIPQLVPVLECAFQQNPANRYVDATAMREAIVALFPSLPGQETLVSWLPRWMEDSAAAPVTRTADIPRTNLAAPGPAPEPPADQVQSDDMTVLGDGPERRTSSPRPRTVAIPVDAPALAHGPGSGPPPKLPLLLVGLAGLGIGALIVAVVLVMVLGPRMMEREPQRDVRIPGLAGGASEVVEEPEGGERAPEVEVAERAPEVEVAEKGVGEGGRGEEEEDATADVTPDSHEEVDPSMIKGEETGEKPAEPSLRPVVSITSQPKVLGALTNDDVTRPLAMALERFNACYAAGLGRDEGLAGAMTQIFVIGPDGKVIETNVDASSVGDAEVERCFSAVIQSMSFPAPTDGEIVVVEYKFGLSSEEIG